MIYTSAEDEPKRELTDDEQENRYLRHLLRDLEKLQRIVETQRPGKQGLHQRQFDAVMHRFDIAHSAMVERGFLPMDTRVPPGT